MVKDLYCILVVAVMFLLSFTKQYTVMHNGINDQEEYKGVHSKFLRLFIQTYKSARDDFAVPTVDQVMKDKTNDSPFYRDIMLSMNLGVALIQEGTFIFLGALFFAKVLEYYEKYTPELPTYMYKTMATFNNECYDIVDMFVPQRNFKVICFAIQRDYERNFGYPGFTRSIQNRVEEYENKRKYYRKQNNTLQDERHHKLVDTKSTVSLLMGKV